MDILDLMDQDLEILLADLELFTYNMTSLTGHKQQYLGKHKIQILDL